MCESLGVFSKRELEARNEIKWETYTKKIQIEARVLGDMAINNIIPVATRYQSLLLDNVYKMTQVYGKDEALKLAGTDSDLIREISERIAKIKTLTADLVEARKVANKIAAEREKAVASHDTVVPFFEKIRYEIDKLEMIVDDEMWTLPKYRELLFIR